MIDGLIAGRLIGDPVAAADSLNPKGWTDKQGNSKPALDLVAHRVVSTESGV